MINAIKLLIVTAALLVVGYFAAIFLLIVVSVGLIVGLSWI